MLSRDGFNVGDTMLLMMFLGLCNLETFVADKMFLNKIRNIFCVPDTMLRARTNGNICVGIIVPATMCPCCPGP